MNWKTLLSVARFGQAKKTDRNLDEIRSEFQRDYDRIIFSSPFRRLQNKTQVFPLPGSVFVHNRLTHSLEVASVGKSLGNIVYSKIAPILNKSEKVIVREIDTVVATACLAHDLGNPPFGHSGEKAISHFFAHGAGKEIKWLVNEAQYADLITFEGNANLIRLLTNQFNGRRIGGYALTFASLGTMIKYPYSSLQAGKKGKYGYFQAEAHTFTEVMQQLQIPLLDEKAGIYARHPLVYLVEAADDICYQLMDIEDAHKLNILPKELVQQLFLNFFAPSDDNYLLKIEQTMLQVTDVNEQIAFLRAMVIGKLTHAAASVFANNYQSIMDGSFKGKLLNYLDDHTGKALRECEELSFSRIYKHPSVIKIEISGYNVIGALLEEFFNAAMHPDQDYSDKILSLMPTQYTVNTSDPYFKARSVVDFISGMTDIYAVDLFKQIKGVEL